MGDVVASFNPIYGQGMTSAAMQTRVLDQVLRQRASWQGFWKAYFKQVAKVHKATQRDPVVYAQFLRTVNLMAPPTSLMSPRIMWRVFMNG